MPVDAARGNAVQAKGVAESAELQLQRWAQWGESSLTQLLDKDASTEWGFVCQSDGIKGFSAPPPVYTLVPALVATTHRAPPPASGRLPPSRSVGRHHLRPCTCGESALRPTGDGAAAC